MTREDPALPDGEQHLGGDSLQGGGGAKLLPSQLHLHSNENRGEYVWIGGAHRASVGPDGQYQWEDNGSKLTGQDEDSYTNWAPTGHPKKNLTDHCVPMAADEGLEGVGGRMNDAPGRTSPSVCQRGRPQFIS